MNPNSVYNEYVSAVNSGLARLLKIARLDRVEVSASGSIIVTENGDEYIDCAGGYGVFTLGHRHPEIIEAVKEQLELMPLASKLFLNRPLGDLAAMLAEVTPGDLQYSFFVNSGAEAVENAIKLARMATGRPDLVATEGAFHGKTLGALSASGREVFRRPFEPLVPGFMHVPFGNLKAIEHAINKETAAVIIEPVQGEGGIRIPPPGYLQGIRELCDSVGALMIADEIQTGLGRTGRLFAVEREEVVPDLMTLGKALGGGVMPIAAVIGRPHTWKEFQRNPLILTSTFGGNPLACAAAIKAVSIITRDRLWERAEVAGARLRQGLGAVAEQFPRVIADVRGVGLLIGVELTREGLGGVVVPEMVKNGVAAGYTLNMPKVIRFEPSLLIEPELIDRIVEVFSGAVEEADRLYEKMFGKL
jgi:putrescine aminotransferase